MLWCLLACVEGEFMEHLPLGAHSQTHRAQSWGEAVHRNKACSWHITVTGGCGQTSAASFHCWSSQMRSSLCLSTKTGTRASDWDVCVCLPHMKGLGQVIHGSKPLVSNRKGLLGLSPVPFCSLYLRYVVSDASWALHGAESIC